MRKLIFLSIIFLLPLCGKAQKASPTDSALHAIKKIKDDTARLNSYRKYAISVESKNPYEAIIIAKVLLREAEQAGNGHYKAAAYHQIAVAYQKMQDFPKSLKYYLEALQLYKKLGEYENQIIVYIDISGIYDIAGDIDNMKRFTDEAWKVCYEHDVEEYKSYLLDRQATIDKKEGRIDLAIKKYKEAIAIAKAHNDVYGQISSLCNMAIALKSAKKYPESLSAYNESLRLTDTAKDLYSYCFILNNMAILFFEKGDLETSEKHAMKTLELQRSVNEPGIGLDMYELLKKIYTRQGRYPEALEYTDKLMALKDTLLNKEKTQQIQELQTRYDTKSKDEQISAQEEQIGYNRKINLFLALSSMLLLAIAILIYRNQRVTRRLNKQITAQKKELEQLNTVKDRIFSVIGHDMRSPVNTLISFIELFENGKISPEELTEYTELLKSNLGYTARLMENLLNWARSQMEGYKPVLEQFDIATVAKQVTGLLSPDAAAKGVAIDNRINDNTIVYADVNMTELLLRNLLSNAIKYSGKGGIISIALQMAGDKVMVSVKDNGTGMSDEQVRSFNANTAQPVSSKPGTANEKGTGLGLMLCKNFAKLMNGNISLVSAPGHGSVFTIELPATALS
jgi:signal transduction histidine kinase